MSSDTSNLIQRRLNDNDSKLTSGNAATKSASEIATEEEEMEPLPSIPSGEGLAKDLGKVEALDGALKDLNPKWKNYIIRFIFTWIMIGGFASIVYLGFIQYKIQFKINFFLINFFKTLKGPLAITLLILAIQVKCFHEIITIGHYVYKSNNLPWFRTLSWYFLITSNYYLYGESLIEKFGLLLNKNLNALMPLVHYHRFFSFSFYTAGFVMFVLSLKKTYYLKQFTLFGYTHLALLLIVTQSNLMIQNVFEGLIWFLLPVSLIICNDVMAYMFGFFFGKTKLIKLSPKKTWEGYIGGAFSTIIFGFILSSLLCNYNQFICPLEYNDETGSVTTENCTPTLIFVSRAYDLPRPISFFLPNTKVSMRPFQIHALALSIFASTIGPFGGFFASGFKRAFKIKDFGDTIPGHGGFMDRFDCQVIMATFVNVYMHSFVRMPSPVKLFNQLLAFNDEDKMEFIRLVNNHFNNTVIRT
jgi:phosphatidate cytidylyltransferase